MRAVLMIGALGSTLLLSATAGADVVVSPSADATAPGDAQTPTPFNRYGTTGSRNQILYPSSDFSALGGAQNITDIKFRPFPGSGPSAFTAASFSISDVIITLSTTGKTEGSANQLSSSYAGNVGADVTTVYSGPLTLTTSATDAPGGATKIFDYDVPLQTPFTYNPDAGNLLLDVTIPNGATVSGAGFGFIGFDDANDNGDGIASIVNLSSGSSATGTFSTDGPIAQFTTAAVPEPGGLTLLGLGGMALIRRKTPRKRGR